MLRSSGIGARSNGNLLFETIILLVISLLGPPTDVE